MRRINTKVNVYEIEKFDWSLPEWHKDKDFVEYARIIKKTIYNTPDKTGLPKRIITVIYPKVYIDSRITKKQLEKLLLHKDINAFLQFICENNALECSFTTKDFDISLSYFREDQVKLSITDLREELPFSLPTF